MRRVFAVTILLILLGMLTGCGSLPKIEPSSYVETEMRAEDSGECSPKMQDIYGSTRKQSTLRESTNAPDTVHYELHGAQSIVSVNADVIVPEVGSIPTVRIKGSNFQQSQVKSYFDYLCSDRIMYNMPTSLTRVQINQQIEEIKSMLSDQPFDDEEYRNALKSKLNQLELEMETAKDFIKEVRADGTFEIQDINHPMTGEVVGHSESIYTHEKLGNGGFGTIFYVNNNSDQKESIFVKNSDEKSLQMVLPKYTGAQLYFRDPSDNFYDTESALIIDESYVPRDDVADTLKMTAAEAKSIVENMLVSTSTPMQISNMKLVSYERYTESPELVISEEVPEQSTSMDREAVSSEAPPQNKNYAYYFECKRIVEGIQCVQLEGASFSDGENVETQNNKDYYSVQECWTYEQYRVKVSDEGIIYLEWNSPLQVESVVEEDYNLKPFSEIQEIFGVMVGIKADHFSSSNEFITQVEYLIDGVNLEFMRVSDPNSIDRGTLVPVWAFYGEQSLTYTYQKGYADKYSRYGCWLIINAIDGTIIDETRGF